MATRDKASIYVDLQNLFRALYDAQWEMAKCNRIVIGVRMLDHCEKALSYFSLAYELEDRKIENIDKMLGEFEMLKVECRFAIDRFYRRDATKNELREYIVKIQEGIDKWRSYVYSARQV